MLSRSVSLQPDPRYDQQVSPADSACVSAFDNSQSREAKRFPAIIVAFHSSPPCTGGDIDAEMIGGVRRHVRNTRQSVVPSPVFREESMQDIAHELQRVVFQAAGEITPGMSIKAQINAACDNLGYTRGFWRVREAWYGDARNWRGEAIFDLLGRYSRFCQKLQSVAGSRAVPVAPDKPFEPAFTLASIWSDVA